MDRTVQLVGQDGTRQAIEVKKSNESFVFLSSTTASLREVAAAGLLVEQMSWIVPGQFIAQEIPKSTSLDAKQLQANDK